MNRRRFIQACIFGACAGIASVKALTGDCVDDAVREAVRMIDEADGTTEQYYVDVAFEEKEYAERFCAEVERLRKGKVYASRAVYHEQYFLWVGSVGFYGWEQRA